LPRPARAAIKANAGDERRGGKGEEAAAVESMETSERKPATCPGLCIQHRDRISKLLAELFVTK